MQDDADASHGDAGGAGAWRPPDDPGGRPAAPGGAPGPAGPALPGAPGQGGMPGLEGQPMWMAGHAPGASDAPCVVCGATPSAHAMFTQGIGMVLMRQQRVARGPFCRDCGLALGRKYESATLITGWWGIISFFLNFANVFTNATGLAKLGKLDPPQGGDPARRLAPGSPVFLRPGFFVAVALFAVAALFVGNSVVNGDKVPSSAVGSCVVEKAGGAASIVPCSSPHGGRIVAVADDESACPAAADAWITQSGKKGVLCVQTT